MQRKAKYSASTGRCTVCTNAFGEDFVVEFDYKITSPGCEAKIFGPPENCYPAEPMEYEIEFVSLTRDVPKPDVSNYWSPVLAAQRLREWEAKVQPIEVSPALKAIIEDWLTDCDKARDAIVEDAA